MYSSFEEEEQAEEIIKFTKNHMNLGKGGKSCSIADLVKQN